MIKVTVALLLRSGAVLMCQRRKTKIYPLHWEFPGGKVEQGESLEQAIARELHEELNISIHSPEEWFHEIATYSNGMTYDITYYLVRDFEPEPENMEFESIEWMTLENLDDRLHLTGNARILEKIRREGIPT